MAEIKRYESHLELELEFNNIATLNGVLKFPEPLLPQQSNPIQTFIALIYRGIPYLYIDTIFFYR